MAGGFSAVNSLGEQGYTGQLQLMYIASSHGSNLTAGDAVVETGTAEASTGVPGCDAIVAGGLTSGVIASFLTNPLNLNLTYLPSGTAGYALVIPATNTQLFQAYVNASGITVADVGANADIVATACTVVGTSYASPNMVINGASYGSSTAQFRIVSLVDGNTGAGAKVIGRFNESTVSGTTGVHV